MNVSSMKTCVIYCRVSDPRQTDGGSLQTQEEMLRDYAYRHNLEVLEAFIEPGESAKTTRRVELQKLLTFVKHRRYRIDVLLVYKFSRLARSVEDHHDLRRALRSCGVQLISINERI